MPGPALPIRESDHLGGGVVRKAAASFSFFALSLSSPQPLLCRDRAQPTVHGCAHLWRPHTSGFRRGGGPSRDRQVLVVPLAGPGVEATAKPALS